MALAQSVITREYEKFDSDNKVRLVGVGASIGVGAGLKRNSLTREQQKFIEDGSGDAAVFIILT